MRVVSLRTKGLLRSFYEERRSRRCAYLIFVVMVFRFLYMVKTKQINPLPMITELMRTEEGRVFVEQILFSGYNNLY